MATPPAADENCRWHKCLMCGKAIKQTKTKAGQFGKPPRYCCQPCKKRSEYGKGAKVRHAANAAERIKNPRPAKPPAKITDDFIKAVSAAIQRGAPLKYAIGSADTESQMTAPTLKRWLEWGRRDNLVRELLVDIASGDITRPEALAEIEKTGETPKAAEMLLDGLIPPKHPKIGELAAAIDKAENDFVTIQLDKIHNAYPSANSMREPNRNWRAALSLLCARFPDKFSERRMTPDGKEEITAADIAAAANVIGDIMRAKAGSELPPEKPPEHNFTQRPHGNKGKPRRRRPPRQSADAKPT